MAYTKTKAHAAAAGSGAGAIITTLAYGWLVSEFGDEGAVAIGTAMTALLGWLATYISPPNKPK